MQRGRPPPGTLTTDGAPGLSKAVDSRGPHALRMRGWCQKREPLSSQGRRRLGQRARRWAGRGETPPRMQQATGADLMYSETLRTPGPKRAAVSWKRPRPGATPSKSRPGIGSRYGPRPWPSGRLRRNAAGPKGFPSGGCSEPGAARVGGLAARQ
jgi:hypothetical protein